MDTAFYLVDELKIKIEQLVKPSELNSLDSQSREILKLVYEHLDSFEETAKTTLLRTDLEKAIRSEVRKLRGIVAQIGSVEFSKDYVEGLKQGLHSFTVELKMEEQRCADGLYNTFPDDEEGEKSSDTVTSEMIGARDVYEQLKHKIMSNVTGYAVSTLVGMPGIGKTTIANNLFYDPTIRQHFECCSWIRAGKRYRLKDIPRRILAEIDPDALPGLEDGKAVQEHLKGILKSKRYFIVLDDVWTNISLVSGIFFFDT